MTTTIASATLLSRRVSNVLEYHCFGGFPCGFRNGILRFHGIIDDDKISTAARQCPADGCRQAIASERTGEFQLSVLARADPRLRKDAPVHVRPHDRAAIVGMFARQSFGIAHTDYLALRIMTENEGRECDRSADRLETAWRHCDNEALDLTLENSCQLVRYGFNVPIGSERV